MRVLHVSPACMLEVRTVINVSSQSHPQTSIVTNCGLSGLYTRLGVIKLGFVQFVFELCKCIFFKILYSFIYLFPYSLSGCTFVMSNITSHHLDTRQLRRVPLILLLQVLQFQSEDGVFNLFHYLSRFVSWFCLLSYRNTCPKSRVNCNNIAPRSLRMT